jgi:hypothetical protein
MAAISEYESTRLMEFFSGENEKKLISIAKTITKNTLTHLTMNGEEIRTLSLLKLNLFVFRCLQNCLATFGIRIVNSQPKTDLQGDAIEISY